MSRISYESWKKYWPIYLLVLALGLVYSYTLPGILESTGVLHARVEGELIVKEQGEVVSQRPLVSCGGSGFGVKLYTSDEEGVYIDPERLHVTDSRLPSEIFYYPPTDGQWFGRPCRVTHADVRRGYPYGVYVLVNLLTSRANRLRGEDYWSGSIDATCPIESTQKSFDVHATFSNCHTVSKPNE